MSFGEMFLSGLSAVFSGGHFLMVLLAIVLGTEGDTVMRPMEESVEHELLLQALGKLSEREREIVVLRYGLAGKKEKTQKEVADLMGISQSYISRLEKKIMKRLKKEIVRFE